ncbi:hypothetical protein ACFV1N_47680, partial [Streptosporangium canum]
MLLPDGATDDFRETYQPVPDTAILRRARGWAVLQALSGILIGQADVRGPGGKLIWGPPAHTSLLIKKCGHDVTAVPSRVRFSLVTALKDEILRQ